MKTKNILASLTVASGMAFSVGAAQSATVGFDVDGPGSSASASVTGCIFCHSSISASTVAGLDAVAFTLDEGESSTFDFVEFSTQGIGGGTFEVSATLAFSDPGGSVSSTGSGFYATFFGAISGGGLAWGNAVQQVSFGNGGLYTVELEDGFTVGLGNSAVASATVTLDAAPVPLPAAGWMLIAGLGGLAYTGRRAVA